jgi:hypothetical protein
MNMSINSDTYQRCYLTAPDMDPGHTGFAAVSAFATAAFYDSTTPTKQP